MAKLSFLQRKAMEALASKIDKSDFLLQLKAEWSARLQPIDMEDINKQLQLAKGRIKATETEFIYKKVGVSDDDLLEVLKEIKAEKLGT